MINRFARPYAQAFLSTSASLEEAETGRDQLRSFVEAMEAVPRLSSMSVNPAVPMPKKKEILEGVCDSIGIQGRTRILLGLLLANYRLPHLGDVVAALEELIDRRRGVVNADVRSATELSDEDQRQLQATLESKLGSKVRLGVEVDPSLLGGFVAQVGSYRYDVSLNGQLERLASGLSRGSKS